MSPAVSLFATVAAAHALAVASPGPDFAVVVRQTLAHGRAAGLRTAWGVACGISLHVGYALFGLSWAIEHVPHLLDALRVIGVVLLLWIGAGALRAAPPAPGAARTDPPAAGRDFAIGFATNALNVKAMLFFVALCSAVVTGGTPAGLRLALGLWMAVATGLWFSLIAWSLGHPRLRERLFAHGHWIDRAMGLVLIGLAIAMAVQGLSRL